ncbi:MAG: 2-oxo-hepta-3-ene-1,7-dioic acid hydratase [Alphaproteobacteria bacterium]|nr:2-oxo-hepta-3-ene-1,7-dioic acid hydratase [Alphaproteobacteria bacterium]
MTPEDHIAAAKRLEHAERARHQIGCISQDFPAMNMADAYAVQGAWVAMKQAAGRQILGRKIGLTSRAMQKQLGIDIPDSGILFDDMLFENNAVIPAGRFIEPRVEAEIAFIMGSDLHGADCTIEDVLNATEAVAPALEILDTRIFRIDPVTGKTRSVLDTISDNAANAGLVLGAERHIPRDVNLPWVGAIVRRGAVVEETGLGAGVLGDPLVSMVWLARRLAQHGDYIRRGEVVLSGSFIRALEAPSGVEFHADFGPFGSVSCAFE